MSRNVLAIALGSAAVVAVGAVIIAQVRGGGREPVQRNSIVLLGDSITAEGAWSSLLPEWPVVGRGEFGFTSAELVPIAMEVGRARPRAVFVLAGTNDIRDGRPAGWTAEHVGEIIDSLRASSPETVIVVQTILPRSDEPEAVRRANEAIRRVAADRGVRLLDLHAPFDDGRGGLRSDDTTDGVHLAAAGYRRWSELLQGEFAELPAPGSG